MQLLASITFGQLLLTAALEDLREEGVLTDDEFRRAKDRVAA